MKKKKAKPTRKQLEYMEHLYLHGWRLFYTKTGFWFKYIETYLGQQIQSESKANSKTVYALFAKKFIKRSWRKKYPEYVLTDFGWETFHDLNT